MSQIPLAVGLTTTALAGQSIEHLAASLAALRATGITGAEILYNPKQARRYPWLGRRLAEAGFKHLSLVAVGSADADPTSKSAIMRNRAVDALLRLGDAAERLGSRRVVGPLAGPFLVHDGDKNENRRRANRARANETFGRYQERGSTPVRIYLEPINRFENRDVNTLGEAEEVLGGLSPNFFGVHLDSAHLALDGDWVTLVEDVGRITGTGFFLHRHVSCPTRGNPKKGALIHLLPPFITGLQASASAASEAGESGGELVIYVEAFPPKGIFRSLVHQRHELGDISALLADTVPWIQQTWKGAEAA